MNTLHPAARLLAAGVCLVTCAACCGGWEEPDVIPFGVSVDLAAVSRISDCNAIECWLAVGSDGTIVWAHGSLPGEVESIQYEVDSFDLGDAALTAVLTTASSWWVVGEGATVAVSEDEGSTWQLVNLGISADLFGIAEHNDRIVVMGDEVVIVRQPDDTWSEMPAPEGGWGRLRDVHSDGTRAYAVGLSGVAWSAADLDGEWVSEDVGVETDLFAVETARHEPDRVGIVGARGTLIVGDHERGWTREDIGTTVDLIDISHSRILAADGEILEYIDGKISSIDTLFAGARALYSAGLDIAVVGDEGEAQRIHRVRRCF